MLIFPPRGLGEEILFKYLETGARVLVLVEGDGGLDGLSKISEDDKSRCTVIKPEGKAKPFWDSLKPTLQEKISSASIVYNFIGNLFLRIKVEGEHQDWRVNLDQASRNRLELVDLVMSNYRRNHRCLWFNVVYGKGGHVEGEQVFCNTRYGVTGFSRAMEMNPALAGIKVINICLTYMHDRFHEYKVTHCNHCVSEKFRGEIDAVKKEKDIAGFLVKKSSQLLEEIAE